LVERAQQGLELERLKQKTLKDREKQKLLEIYAENERKRK